MQDRINRSTTSSRLRLFKSILNEKNLYVKRLAEIFAGQAGEYEGINDKLLIDRLFERYRLGKKYSCCPKRLSQGGKQEAECYIPANMIILNSYAIEMEQEIGWRMDNMVSR